MNFSPSRFAFRRAVRRGAAASRTSDPDVDADAPLRAPEDLRVIADPAEPGWRGSSYDLKHGLDVLELPTSLPVAVLDRLFNAPGK